MVDQADNFYMGNQQNMVDEMSNFGNANDGDSIKVSSVDEVMELLKKLDGISDEERERLRLEILKHQAQAGNMIKEQIIGEHSPSSDYIVFIAMISIIVMIFVLFGYKLYKSLMEKQKKREEKLKAKQSKKKNK